MLIEEVSEHIIARRKQNPGMEPIKLDGMNLLYEADWLSKGLRYDFLWFIYLREVAGIYLTPDQQAEVSFFCPSELRGPAWNEYEKSFLDWRDNVYFGKKGYVEGQWFDTTKGMLLVTSFIGPNGYAIAIDTIERNHGPRQKVGYKIGATVLQVLDWLADQLEVMDEYVRKGWLPMVQLPLANTERGLIPVYTPDGPEHHVFLDPRDFGAGE